MQELSFEQLEQVSGGEDRVIVPDPPTVIVWIMSGSGDYFDGGGLGGGGGNNRNRDVDSLPDGSLL